MMRKKKQRISHLQDWFRHLNNDVYRQKDNIVNDALYYL